MATIFNPTSTYSNKPTATTSTKNWWDMPTSAGKSGADSIYGFQLPDFSGIVSNQRAAGGQMLQGQDQQVGNWLSNYSGAINNQEKMRAMYSRLGDELGLPGLMSQANTLNATLEAVPQTYTAATRGFDTNANQLARIVGTKQAQLAPLAQKATTQAQFAQDQLGVQMGLEQQQQAKELSPYTYEKEFLMDRIARETSMFTTANENELNALVAKMQSGVELNEGEKKRINDLTIAREGYQNALAVQKLSNEGSLAVANANNAAKSSSSSFNWSSWGL